MDIKIFNLLLQGHCINTEAFCCYPLMTLDLAKINIYEADWYDFWPLDLELYLTPGCIRQAN